MGPRNLKHLFQGSFAALEESIGLGLNHPSWFLKFENHQTSDIETIQICSSTYLYWIKGMEIESIDVLRKD